MKYLSLDTETGGLGLDKSLLTLGLVFADENFNETSKHHWLIKPNDGVYRVTGKALEINGIDLKQHDKEAFTEKEVSAALYQALNVNSDFGKQKIIPIGKQVDGDILHIWDKLISRNTWEQFVSYRRIEVSSIFLLMQAMGAFPANNPGSLKSIAEHYQIDTSKLHNALRDAELTLEVYKRMFNVMKYQYLIEGT